jgi:hypothetical protein
MGAFGLAKRVRAKLREFEVEGTRNAARVQDVTHHLSGRIDIIESGDRSIAWVARLSAAHPPWR